MAELVLVKIASSDAEVVVSQASNASTPPNARQQQNACQ
jgi:hypothetical protein